MKRWACLVGLLCVLGSSSVFAQETKPVETKPVPTISKQDSDNVLQMQADAMALRKAITVLQRELDATTAEFVRTMQRLQLPDYQIVTGPNGLVYVAAPKAEPPRKVEK